MIVGRDWVWLHVPKCAGTTTEATLRKVFKGAPDVVFDPVGARHPVIWHHTVAKRKEMDPSFCAENKRIVGNIRRLPSWLLSRVHFEAGRHGDRAAPSREQLCQGLFPNPTRKTGAITQISADRQIGHFADEITDWIRTESLREDLQRVFNLSPGRDGLSIVSLNETKLRYIKALDFWFTPRELAGLYEANPIWAAIEKQVYGDILTL